MLTDFYQSLERNCQMAQEKCGTDLSCLSHSRLHRYPLHDSAAQGRGQRAWVWVRAECQSRAPVYPGSPSFGPQDHRREGRNHRKQGWGEGFREDLLSEPPLSHLSFHASPPLFLLFPFPHVLVLLFRFCHSLKKLIENPKELIWLDFASLFPKVLHRFSELEKKIWKKEKKTSVFQENWFLPSDWILPRRLKAQL